MIEKKIFNDTETAFRLKTDLELNRALLLFNVMGIPSLIKPGILLTKFSLKARLPIQPLIKSTIFDQFCAGTSKDDCKPVIKEMHQVNLSSILDYSVEGKKTEEEFDAAFRVKKDLIKFAQEETEIPFAIFKPTALGSFEIWHKLSSHINLNEEEKVEWQKTKARVEDLCEEAYKLNVRLYADAEESWMQDAADDLMEEMMEKYNKDKALIFNTFQCYRWDRLDYLKALHKKANEKGFKIGAKIVRGAYMEKENKRAKKYGKKSPICENKKATDLNFNNVMTYCLDNIDDIAVFIGTHNEMSNYLALQAMEDQGIAKDDPRVWFSQLYGMSDQISYNLASKDYNTAKLVPFGPVKEVVPYLLRRAEENSSVEGQTNRELNLLQGEKKRRKLVLETN
ncbi:MULTISPECIES: proline dehydrogenase family protein [unclassified Salegentibacter]|jgi:proline dehydrogenase|uniref:proline dehydrogenase family protein n=1 Tax=unclassified Salegentibacter TaxID=2633436 RepID=UPI00094A8F26|nr:MULTISPECIES: proline dehydrogenase family protein [unclassified Salegentibacter]APS40507.1 proline dehydrogenase [Salegentibacter sp. T436]